MMRFGLGIVAVGLLGQGAKNFDYVVVGAKLGAAALGVYYLAFRLPELVIVSGFQRGQRRAVPASTHACATVQCRRSTTTCGGAICRRSGWARWWHGRRPRHGRARPSPGPRPSTGRMARGGRAAGLRCRLGRPRLAGEHARERCSRRSGARGCSRRPGLMQIAILFPAIWFAAPYGITAVAASRWPRRPCRWPCSGSSSAAYWESPGTRPSLPPRPRWPSPR